MILKSQLVFANELPLLIRPPKKQASARHLPFTVHKKSRLKAGFQFGVIN